MGFSNLKLIKILAACFVSLPVLFTLTMIYRSQPNNHTKGLAKSRDFHAIADIVDPLEPVPAVVVHASPSTASPFTASFTPPFVALHGRYHHGRVPAIQRR
ncbi:hypothetical protein RHMOL_Rhmol12G0086400 [Rhododendron molle]|uniref:Uncharacterized protein n=1 Tax=Rhododendron molle TaxID=49168 RepID=A0ACC0LGT0_RHOML|nr:hypothetical protein RHMOL_Rhmol12G0086400 [Rhododendron molle]